MTDYTIIMPNEDPVVASASDETDWELRIAGSGVVWFHTFDSADEVDAFRWTNGYSGGNDPNAVGSAYADNVRHVASGGADGGGYMELNYEAAGAGASYWHRPLSPLASPGNGRDSDDPAASGTLTVGSYTATNGGDQIATWGDSGNAKPGWYAHPDDVTSYHDGNDFYLQIRVWADPRRTIAGQPSVGKFTSFSTTNYSNTNQEQVTYSAFFPGGSGLGADNVHNIYDGWAYSPLVDISGASGDANPTSPAWSYSTTGWDTLLYHITPGVDGGTYNRMEVWAAQDGETSYTKIWDWSYPIHYDDTGNGAGGIARDGWNAVLCWMYQNGVYSSTFWQRYDQLIFSKNFIPCPQSGTLPSWYPGVGEVVEIDSGTTISSAAAADGANSYPNGSTDLAAPWCGGAMVYVGGQPYLVVEGGGHGDGSYNGKIKFGPLYGAGSDSPTWSTFLTASAVGDVQEGPVYADGRQAANHTYDQLVGVGDRFYSMYTSAYHQISNSSNRAFYSTPDGQVEITSNIGGGQGNGAYAHYNGKIYGHGVGFDKLRIYDPANDIWASASETDTALYNYPSAAVDTSRGGLLIIGGQPGDSSTTGIYWDLSDFSRNVDRNRPGGSWESAVIYDPDRDAFVSYADSLTVQEVDAASLAAGNNPSWTTRTFTGDTPASAVAAGTYGRFQYVPELKGYIVAPNSNSSVYFFRSA